MKFSFEEHHLKSKAGLPLLYDFAYKETLQKKPLIIFLHGFKGFKDWGHFRAISDYMISKEVIFLKINFSHNGTTIESPLEFNNLEAFGNNNFSKEIADIDSLIDILHSNESPIPMEEIDLTNITLLGHSKGAATAIIKGQDERINKVATWAGTLEIINRYGSTDIEKWRSDGVKYIYNGRTNQNMPIYFQLSEDIEKNKESFNISNILKSYNKPIFILHPQDDTTIPVEELNIAKEANNPLIKIAINKGNHTLDGHHPYCNCKLPEATIRACDKTLNFIFS